MIKELGYKQSDPLFPKNKLAHNKNQPLEVVGLLYFIPHSFRNTLVRLGENLCRASEEFKAWSQNLGHESVLTSFYSYGDMHDYKQSELLRKLANLTENISSDIEDQFKQFIAFQKIMTKK
ncbi:hypothetical protein ABN220_10030 [Proteus cibi]|uniref:hypothetical protein n=1 Tax=Proteus cibi TaxID=2050966 RepID=UPI0032DB58C8